MDPPLDAAAAAASALPVRSALATKIMPAKNTRIAVTPHTMLAMPVIRKVPEFMSSPYSGFESPHTSRRP